MDPAYNPPPAGQQQPGYPPSITQPPSSMQEEGGGTYNDAPHDPLRYQQPSSSNFMHQQNHDGVGGVGTSGDALNALTAAAVAATPAPTVPNTMPTNMKISSPQGKIVESGMEHTGRWTKEEHEAFMAALQLYGKEWKKVAAKVKTRTIVQTRTHAQKYFQKLQKVLEAGGDKDSVMANLNPGSFKAGDDSSPNDSPTMELGVPPSTEKKAKKRGPKSTGSAQKKPQQQQQQQLVRPQPQYDSRSNSSNASNAAGASVLLNMSNDRRPSAILYSDALGSIESEGASGHGFGSTANSTWDNITTQPLATGISIVAPRHEDMLNAGKFPEPSPAACGKRKLAEIAAAQMLAGVTETSLGMETSPNAAKRASISGAAASDHDPAIEEGKLTLPPPPPAEEEHTVNTPAAPANGVVQPGSTGGGLALQIVNPDSLNRDQDNGGFRRRVLSGQASPLTPWDGQLEALVSQVKSKEPGLGSPNGQTTAADDAEAEEVAAPEILVPSPLNSPRSNLQLAVRNGSVLEVSQICSTLDSSQPSVINERDDAGFHPLHSAAALGLLDQFGPNCQESLEICKLLLNIGADVMCLDKEGNTPVHWAARAGHIEVLRLLLVRNCPLDVQNDDGETPLHLAMRAGDKGAGAVKVLVENGARVNVFNRSFRRPLDVAAEGFTSLLEGAEGDGSSNMVSISDRRSTRWNLMQFSSQCRTLVIHHQECLDHLAKADHDWEVPDRVENIISTLTSRTAETCHPGDDQSFKPCEVTISNDFERATLELLSRIHSAEYLAFVNDLSKELERKRKQQLIEESYGSFEDGAEQTNHPVVPFTPMVQRKIMKESTTKEDVHSDTAFSAGSLKAARRAAGAVQYAVDCVMVGRSRNAFCIVRPPGHHAGINGLLSDAESCGFCLFNNVAAGAMHALSDEKHRPRCERCAIVDIDAHHGNGTEEIVKKCHDSGRLLFFSVHLYDHDKPKKGAFNYKFYPGTGAEDDVAHNIINVPIAPLWREKEVVKSISLASEGPPEPRQTRQRSKEEASRRVPSLPDLTKYNSEEYSQPPMMKHNGVSADTSSVASDSSQASKPRPPLPSASPHYPPHYLMGTGRLAYRRAIQHRLLPALRAFNPDLIILSTGFDAARGDVGNARHYVNGTEAIGFDLEPEDYAWTSRKICEVADICCDGRVVSVLEGGYGRTPPPVPAPPFFGSDSAEEQQEQVKQKLDKTFFSECAIQHLKGLVDPYNAEDEQNSLNRKRP